MAKRLLFAGAPGVGKSTLCKALLGLDDPVRKTQSVVFHKNLVVDLPGEFLTHPRLRTAFLASVQGVGVILYLQPADAESPRIPDGLLHTAPNVAVIGVISKADAPGADHDRAAKHLQAVGIKPPYFTVSALHPESTNDLRAELQRRGVLPSGK